MGQEMGCVSCEPSFAGPEHVFRYLGQYTHHVAISNHNIINISGTHVKFIAKDYRDKAKKKPERLTGASFCTGPASIYCLKGLSKYGTLVFTMQLPNGTPNCCLGCQLSMILKNKKLFAVECLKRALGIDVALCPGCKKGAMKNIKEIPRIRSPYKHLPTLLLSFLA